MFGYEVISLAYIHVGYTPHLMLLTVLHHLLKVLMGFSHPPSSVIRQVPLSVISLKTKVTDYILEPITVSTVPSRDLLGN